ncbi:hypothetical protein ABFS83_12G045700 [Erythranthe nasuta]
MEDEHICIDNLTQHLGDIANANFLTHGAFYGVLTYQKKKNNVKQVFDGHGGSNAAYFIRNNILKFIIENSFSPIVWKKQSRMHFKSRLRIRQQQLTRHILRNNRFNRFPIRKKNGSGKCRRLQSGTRKTRQSNRTIERSQT